MFKSLYFKIVLILLIFVIAVMCVVGAILMNGVSSFYVNDFFNQMSECFAEDSIMMGELYASVGSGRESVTDEMKSILSSYGSILGIDRYRNYYVLNMDGEMLTGSDASLGVRLTVTPNILSAINRGDENRVISGSEYADWACYISAGGEECIIYIKDSLDEMRQLNQVLFSIILQAMFIGIIIAILLSFFLAKSISSPLQSLTYGAQLVAAGEFSYEIDIHSEDEIGVLTHNFNYMKDRLKMTLEEVDGEREKLETVLSCIRDGVIAFTADGRVLHSNSSADEQFEFDKNDKGALEKCFDILDIPLMVTDNSIKISSPDAQFERTKDSFIFHDKMVGDKVYDVNFGIIKYYSGEKKSFGFIIVMHDVTGRYELDESRREFVANVSHELRTPLTSIMGAAETIVNDPEMDDEMRVYFLDMVLTESERMMRIVSDLLVLSRLDNKRTRWNIETFDIGESVHRLCEVMRTDVEAHEHELSFEAEDDLPEVTADRQRIEQVIINIISNAIKYTPNGGKIDVNVSGIPAKNRVLVKISDNGIGIPEEDIAHLFERFYRVEKSRTSDAGGTGLGLAIAKELIDAHGGSIRIESALDAGTAVYIEIPVECRLKSAG